MACTPRENGGEGGFEPSHLPKLDQYCVSHSCLLKYFIPNPFPHFYCCLFLLGALTQLLSKFKRLLQVGHRVGSISSSFGSPVVDPTRMQAQEMAGNRA